MTHSRDSHVESGAQSSVPQSSAPAAAELVAAPLGRRRLLQAAGVALAGAAATVAGAGRAEAAPLTPTSAVTRGGIRSVPTVAALRALRPAEGSVVLVTGYATPGDGGAMYLRWNATSDAAPNGGTVIAPDPAPARGRWHQLHDGTGDFRRFGLFGAETPADDALDAMVNDPSFSRIEGHSDLNFVRRHLFTRSDLVLDFGNHLMTTAGIADAAPNDPFAAVLSFRGTVSADVQSATLTAVMPELADVFEVNDSGFFAVGSWYAAVSDRRPGGGSSEMELQRLLEVTEIVDANHIRVNYKNGWELGAGRVITWTRVDPVQRVHVRNLRFSGGGTDQVTGSSPVAYEYATHCDAHKIVAEKTYWPVIMRRWATHYVTSQCELSNPISVTLGGAGYLTQQIYCLYGHVVDCHTSNARHLNDFTGAAYCLVENCHGDGDLQGPFVTHGQYEHDLTYTGNSGLMTFANSGATWGGRAKRISVSKHVCALFFARVGVTDLTLEDVSVVRDPSMPDYPAWMWINADGAQLRGCRVDGRLQISQATTLSTRATVLDGCTVGTTDQEATLPMIAADVTRAIHVVRSTITGLDGASSVFLGTGELTFTGSTLVGRAGAAPVTMSCSHLRLHDTRLVDTGVVMTGTDQSVTVTGGSSATGSGTNNAIFSRAGTAGTVSWTFAGLTSTLADAAGAHILLDRGTNHVRSVGSSFTGGALTFTDAGFGPGSSLLHSGCVESGVARTLPSDNPSVLTDGNLVL